MMRIAPVLLACVLVVAGCGPSEEERVANLETSARTLVAAIDRGLAVTGDGTVVRDGPIVGPCEQDRYAIDHAAERNGLDPDTVAALEEDLARVLGGGPREQDRLEDGAAVWSVALEDDVLVSATLVPREGRFNLSGSTPCVDVPLDEARRILAEVSGADGGDG